MDYDNDAYSPFEEDTVTGGRADGIFELEGESEASLVVLTGSRAGRTQSLGNVAILGRDTTCELTVEGSKISRRHARIERRPAGYAVIDLNSSNGTLVNGVPVSEQELQFGDRVSLGGDVLLLFTRHDKLQEQLLHQQRMESIGQLAGGVAHDFNNLLGTVLGNASVLCDLPGDTPLEDEEVMAVVEDIRLAARQAAELTQQLLGFARRGNYVERPTSVSDLADEVVRLCSRTFDRAIEIESKIQPDLSVLGDRSQLHQLIMNILLNARDSMAEGGRLKVELRQVDGPVDGFPSFQHGPSIVITVDDEGSGMPEEVRRRVFEPFFTTKGLGRGTGMGLAMLYGIVRSHGGDIRVESVPGRGSTFEVCLPAHAPAFRESMPPTREINAYRPPHRATVLVVDDEVLCIRSTRRLLQTMGYDVLVAENGARGVAVYERNRQRIDLVLLDLMMPVMGGEEACRKLLAFDPAVKILAMSGYSEEVRAHDMLEAGALGFIRKPFDLLTLEHAIGELVAQPMTTPARVA